MQGGVAPRRVEMSLRCGDGGKDTVPPLDEAYLICHLGMAGAKGLPLGCGRMAFSTRAVQSRELLNLPADLSLLCWSWEQ